MVKHKLLCQTTAEAHNNLLERWEKIIDRNLLIIGAGTYGIVASEIAADMRCFEKIDFIDDERKTTPAGNKVIGTTNDIDTLASQYGNIIVAIGNPQVRFSLLNRIKKETPYRIVSLVSPRAYVAPTAKISAGCIVEPMAVVHTGSCLSFGCIVSAGAVINHEAHCGEVVHVDCNATVDGYCLVPAATKVSSGDIYKQNTSVKIEDLSFDSKNRQKN